MESKEVWRQNLITIQLTSKVTETVTIQDAQILTYTFTAQSRAIAESAKLVRTRRDATNVVEPADYTLDLGAGSLTLESKIVAAEDVFELSYQTLTPLRLWTGQGGLRVGSHLYQGGGAALGVSEVETTSGEPDKRVTLSLSGIPRALRRQFLQDVGPKEVLIEWIFSRDRGVTWSKIPISFRGRLSTPSLSEGAFQIEIETQRGDVDRGRPLRWSHEDQQRRHPGDLGLEHMRALAKQGVETGWPP